ncbi:MAG: hypothetical protein ACOX6V_03665 [Patescibacteria group bacterium]|jgi:hypothetical protein
MNNKIEALCCAFYITGKCDGKQHNGVTHCRLISDYFSQLTKELGFAESSLKVIGEEYWNELEFIALCRHVVSLAEGCPQETKVAVEVYKRFFDLFENGRLISPNSPNTSEETFEACMQNM